MLTLRPSAAGVWVKCPGSVKMQAEAPSYGDPHTGDEGTAAHWAAAEQLHGRGTPEGMKAPNGVLVTEEMLGYIAEYVDAVQATSGELHIEETVACVSMGFKGTPDCWAFDLHTGVLRVWDFKYGWGIVEPKDNWQMICYVLGITDNLPTLPNGQYALKRIEVVIAQPRPYHQEGTLRIWNEQHPFFGEQATQLRQAATEALSESPTVTAGKHCKYCTARYSCPSADRASLMALDLTENATLEYLPDAKLGLAIEVLRRAQESITFRLTGLEQRAISTIQQGGYIDGWTTEHGQGHKAWTKPAEDIFVMGDLLGIDLRAEPKPITPVQAKKKGLSADMLAVFSDTPAQALKLKQVGDTLAGRAFGGEG